MSVMLLKHTKTSTKILLVVVQKIGDVDKIYAKTVFLKVGMWGRT